MPGIYSRKYPVNIRKLLSKKQSACGIYIKSQTATALNRYKNIAYNYRKALYIFKCNCEHHLIKSGNTGAFFRYSNPKLKTRASVAPLTTPSGDVSSDPTVKAELLNDYFSSSFQIDNNVIPNCPPPLPTLSFEPRFTIAKVKTLMRKLNPKSAVGPDGFHPIFFKNCNESLSQPLVYLFRYHTHTHSFLQAGGTRILFQSLKRVIHLVLQIIGQFP